MKTRKFTKVVSFILALTILATTLLVNSFKVSAAVTPVETQCIRCDATLGWSGPYLGSVPTPNDSTFGGAYVVDSDRDEWHYYIIKCPDFKNTLLGKKHDNYPAVERHNYTSTYTQYDSSRHTRTYTCTKNNAAYNIVGTEGCGYTKDVLEAHYASWQRRAAATDDHHVIQQMCICGYVISSTPEEHTFEDAKYYHYNINQHHITKFCTVCQDTIHIYENHKFTYSAWTNNSSTQHKRTATCSDCGYTKTEYADHGLTTSAPLTYGTEDENDSTYPHGDYHKYNTTCSDCNYTSTKYEPHEMFIEVDWYDYDDTDHKKMTQCSICEYGVSYYSPHKYPIDRYSYTSVNETTHSITKHCDTCDRAVDGGSANHSYVYGKWVDNGDGTCTREKTCSLCGYKSTDSANHSFTYGEWLCDTDDKLCSNAHRRINTCSNCGFSEKEYEDHSQMFVWDQDSWQPFSEKMHHRTRSCTVCKQTRYSYSVHHYRIADDKYAILSADEHERTETCYECGEPKITVEAHSFTASTIYTQFSETQHQVTQSCICGEKHISYADHVDQNSDCYCDKCGYLMTKFSVTVPTTMVLTMGTDGEVYAPSDVVIINNSTAAVSVKKADINSRNGWNIVPYSTNMANEKVDSKKIGFKMNGIQTDSSGTTDSLSYNNSWIIEKDTSSAVIYDAVVSATSTPINEQVIEIVYIVDWKE